MTSLSIGEPNVTTIETTTYPPRPATSRGILWTGRVLSTLFFLFMLMDGVMKLFKPQFVVDATTKIGYPQSSIIPIGIAATVGAILYAIPRTAVLGAIILTGFLGGAVATNVQQRTGEWWLPALFGVVGWLGLVLRDERIREVLPMRRAN